MANSRKCMKHVARPNSHPNQFIKRAAVSENVLLHMHPVKIQTSLHARNLIRIFIGRNKDAQMNWVYLFA